MNIIEKNILKFDNDWKPATYNPNKEGFYMTIRCGLGGIYTMLNEWKDNSWQTKVTDDSTTIAYSKEQITEEQVKEWCNNIINKYKNNE